MWDFSYEWRSANCNTIVNDLRGAKIITSCKNIPPKHSIECRQCVKPVSLSKVLWFSNKQSNFSQIVESFHLKFELLRWSISYSSTIKAVLIKNTLTLQTIVLKLRHLTDSLSPAPRRFLIPHRNKDKQSSSLGNKTFSSACTYFIQVEKRARQSTLLIQSDYCCTFTPRENKSLLGTRQIKFSAYFCHCKHYISTSTK